MKFLKDINKTSFCIMGVIICFFISIIGQASNKEETLQMTSTGVTSDSENEIEDSSSASESLDESENEESSSEKSIIDYSKIEILLDNEVKEIVSLIDEKGWELLSEVIINLDNTINFQKDNINISEEKKSLFQIVLLSEIQKSEIINADDINDTINKFKNILSLKLESFERIKYNDSKYVSLVSDSENFSKLGKKTNLALPKSVVLFEKNFGLKNSPIKYDDNILISLDDILQYIDADVQKTEATGVVSLQSENILLEFTSGENLAYVNDKPHTMSVPTLYYKNNIYISIDFFADTYGILCEKVKDTGTIILYGKTKL